MTNNSRFKKSVVKFLMLVQKTLKGIPLLLHMRFSDKLKTG